MSEEAAPPASPPAEQPGGEGEEASPPPFKPPCLDLTEFPLKADYFEVRVEGRAGWGLYWELCVAGDAHGGRDGGEDRGSSQLQTGHRIPGIRCRPAKPRGHQDCPGKDQRILWWEKQQGTVQTKLILIITRHSPRRYILWLFTSNGAQTGVSSCFWTSIWDYVVQPPQGARGLH